MKSYSFVRSMFKIKTPPRPILPILRDISEWKPKSYIDAPRIKTLHQRFSIPEYELQENQVDHIQNMTRQHTYNFAKKVFDGKLYELKETRNFDRQCREYTMTIGVLDPNENV